MSGDTCRECGAQLDDFGQCMTCDTYGTPADQRADKTDQVLTLILNERVKQDAKWSQQNHRPLFWLAILGEEFGEVSKEVVEAEAAFQKAEALNAIEGQMERVEALDFQHTEHLLNLKAELIQTAAVCVAMLESLERNQGVTL